jgi:hypothetical protein
MKNLWSWKIWYRNFEIFTRFQHQWIKKVLLCLSLSLAVLSPVCGDYIRRLLDWQLDLLDTLTVILNYSVYTLQLTVHYNMCRVFLLVSSLVACLPTPYYLFTFRTNCHCFTNRKLLILCSVTHLYSREHGCAYCCVVLVTRHVKFTVPLPRARASAILFASFS